MIPNSTAVVPDRSLSKRLQLPGRFKEVIPIKSSSSSQFQGRKSHGKLLTEVVEEPVMVQEEPPHEAVMPPDAEPPLDVVVDPKFKCRFRSGRSHNR